MSDYSEDEQHSLVLRARNATLLPFRVLSSKPAQRAYLTSFLFVSTCLFLLVVSITAYVLFYWTYIPRMGFTRSLHLQFDNFDQSPWGVANLAADLVSLQPYDVSVQLRVPRSKTNTENGNFMLETALYAPGEKGSLVDANIPYAKPLEIQKILASSRRSAILTYYSPVVDLARKATELHWFILGWRLEAETLEVPVFEAVSFEKGWRNVPATLQLQIHSEKRMQIYDAKVIFKARFRGLRWLMYNYRLSTACIFIGAFWGTEVLFTAICWAVLTIFLFPSADSNDVVKAEKEDTKRIKNEESEDAEEPTNMSDTERSFPTYSKAPPLRYQSTEVKQEEQEPEPFPPLFAATEADDEDDEDNDFLLADSGLGTSMESSSGRPESVRKRKSRPSGGKL